MADEACDQPRVMVATLETSSDPTIESATAPLAMLEEQMRVAFGSSGRPLLDDQAAAKQTAALTSALRSGPSAAATAHQLAPQTVLPFVRGSQGTLARAYPLSVYRQGTTD